MSAISPSASTALTPAACSVIPTFAGLLEPVDELDQIIALAANQRALETDNGQPMCN